MRPPSIAEKLPLCSSGLQLREQLQPVTSVGLGARQSSVAVTSTDPGLKRPALDSGPATTGCIDLYR